MAVYFEDVCDNPNAITAVELRLLTPFTQRLLDELRLRAVDAVAEGPLRSRARGVTLRAWGTEVRAALAPIYTPSAEALASRLRQLRRLPATDARQAVTPDHRLVRAMDELRGLGAPREYTDLLLEHCRSTSTVHRVAGRCAVVLMASVLIVG